MKQSQTDFTDEQKTKRVVLRHLCPVHKVKARSALNCLTLGPPQGRFDRCHSINNDLMWLFFSLGLQPANILLDEHGHVRISDLGLACDFSKKKPHASV